MKLILIEGPGKRESVQHYLGKEYKVMPTYGHCRDLPIKTLGVDVENNFEPEYVVAPDHKKTVDAIKKEMSKAEAVYFASDPDREGEAITWHMCHLLGIDPKKANRITYNEISQVAVNEAINNPRPIDDRLVDAQQARRVLDRLVGYKISPILCKKIQNNLSAGRVQSVTLRLVVDREREIENFKPEEYWTLYVILSNANGKKETFKATLNLGKNKTIKNKEEMDKILDAISSGEFIATNVKKSVTKSQPSAPFTTSTMQQEALNKLGMNLKTTSSVAQSLYEGVEIQGEGKVPLVTYIRTDSVRVAPEAQAKAKKFISNKFGDKYVVKSPRTFKNKKDVQDAHEAIRPISLDRKPEDLKDKMHKNEYRLYKLIYDRFLASQMADATYDSLSVDIECNGYKFKTTGRAMTFDGYTAVYNNDTGENDDKVAKLPNIEKGDKFDLKDKKPEQKWTKPPSRYTEASLVKAMEEKGIGRPSTYTQSVTTLFYRHYVDHDGKLIVPTELGKVVVDMLVKFFPNIMDIGFTAGMENNLDDIEYEGKDWRKMISEFYAPFIQTVKIAAKDGSKAKVPEELSDVDCELCGSKMVIRTGKYGKFLACPNFPTCKNTKPLVEEKPIEAKCPTCGKNIKTLKSKRGKIFYGCEGYPTCTFMSWNIPANEKCPNCSEEMIVKLYKNLKVISCEKCNYNRKEKIENNGSNENSSSENTQTNNINNDVNYGYSNYGGIGSSGLSIREEIEILNKLDEENGL
ncbi:MAG: type I DNA topoisomerase [Clostridia bacterium]|nr:type I DNA topoisomerase [Clostridia bacterium]